MKSKFKFGLLAIVAMSALASCSGGSTSETTTTDDNTPAGDITINVTEEEIADYKQNPVSLTFWSPIVGPDAGYFQNILKAWNDKYGDYINIQSDALEEEAHYKRIITSFTDSSTADITMIHAQRFSRYQRTGYMRDMTNIISKAGLTKDQYIDNAWDTGAYGDKMYGLPLDMLPTFLFYNKKLLPEGYSEADILSDTFTYEKMTEMMKAGYQHHTVRSKRVYGAAFNYGYCEEPFITNLYSLGGVPVTKEDPTTPLYNDAKSFEAVKAIESIPFTYDDEGHKTASESGSDHRTTFKSAKALFTIDGIWSASSLVFHNDKVDTGIALLPRVNSSAKRLVYCDSHMLVAFNNKNVSDYRDNAISLFIKYFTYNSLYWCQSGKVAVRKDVTDNETYKALDWAFVSDIPSQILVPEQIYSFQTITAHAAETISEICEGNNGETRYTDAEIQSKLDKSVEESKNLVKNLK